MDIEIELKFFVFEQHIVEKINSFLQTLKLPFTHDQKLLNNSYFDTETLQLRANDFGLRIRTSTGFKEQTIKTAGNVIGGLHQRPEYNVEIVDNLPDLALFPRDIWLPSQDLEQLQGALNSIFNTNFCRHTWLIDYSPSTKIELAYDAGSINTKNGTVPISEIELELLTGNTEHLLVLADKLANQLQLLPGVSSKAARGYALFGQQAAAALPNIHSLDSVPLRADLNIEQAFSLGLQFALNQLQTLVNQYVEQPELEYLVKITEMLALMRHGFWLFQSQLPAPAIALREQLSHFIKLFAWVDNASHFKELTDKTGNYRHKLEFSQQLVEQLKFERNQFPDAAQVCEIFRSARFNQMQLTLLRLILSNELLRPMPPTITLYAFAEQALEQSLAQLTDEMPQQKQLSVEQYLAQYKLLIRCLLSGSWFGNLYQLQQRNEFRDLWLDIKQGIAELQTLWLIKQHLRSVEQCPEKFERWLDTKVENLLLALDHSKASALAIKPYWR